VGIAWASLPLLAPLRESAPERYREAVARATAFFNANPFLAGAAVGAAAREELGGAPGERVTRLRTALCGPLGAIGDQLFWLGTVPGLAALALAAVALGAGWWAPVLMVAAQVTLRMAVGAWALDLGLQHGTGVGSAIQRSWLSVGVEWAGRAAAVLVGLALPLVAWWQLEPVPTVRRWLALALGLALYRLASRWRGRATAVEYTLVAMLVVLLWHWSTT
jgi:mannose/fructose/N-acetylgalactosamine-specific phosphotransferase system component IID